MTDTKGYFVEWNGDCWQSVFPESLAHLSQLHTSPEDAVAYIQEECPGANVTILQHAEDVN